MVLATGSIRDRGRRAFGHHCPVRPAGDRTGACDIRRRLGFCRARYIACVRGLRRHLAAGNGWARPRATRLYFWAWHCSPTQPISAPARCDCQQFPTSPPTRPTRPASTSWRALRPRGRTDYPGPAVAALQRTAYPDVIPLDLDVPTKIAYDAALALVTKRKWYIGDTRPPTLARRDGVIEAVARTPIMGFRDDVVIG